MHITMNMMSLIAIGSSLEIHFGSLWITCTILWSILLTSAVYVLVAFSIYALLGIDRLMYSHSVGFSGVLFHLSVIQAYIHPNGSRQVFGMFNVPSTAYPWVLMAVLQVFMPNLSLLGHLSGVICGTCQAYGLLNWICLPGGDYLRSCDDGLRTVLTRRTSPFVAERYVSTSLISPPLVLPQQQRDTTALRRVVSSTLGSACKLLQDCGDKIRVAVFGHSDARGNDNIRFTTNDVATALGIGFGNTDYDDDGGQSDVNDDGNPCIGLPSIPKISPPRESSFV